MNILVTGASGFLGQNLSNKLISLKPNKIILLDSKIADLTLPDSLHQFNDIKFDKIYHLACWTQAGDFSIKHAGEEWLINQQINTNTIKWWYECQKQAKFISMGTSCAYPENGSYKEETYFDDKPIESLFSYAMSKRMLQNGVESISKQFGLNYITFVPSTLYGPGYSINDKIPHFIFDLIKKFIRYKKYNEEIILWGDGNQIRELIYVDDFIDYMIRIESLDIKNEIFNIGAGTGYSIKHFAKIICEEMNINFNDIQFDTNAFVGSKSKVLNTEKISKLVNLKQVSLKEGIKKTINDLYAKVE